MAALIVWRGIAQVIGDGEIVFDEFVCLARCNGAKVRTT
ncbi:phytochelatin synthase family protein [Tolypothrix sp. FACHB-123]|nr:phytochelatin synthase family protein [Tolypothrix sp. FACHB-123]